MSLPVDSAVARTAPQAPAASPASQPDPQFDAALKKAQADRSAADGNPSPTRGNEVAHEVKPGETLSSIADTYRTSFSGVLKDNPQLSDPDHIEPGQVVFVPNPDPRVVNTRQAVASAHQAEAAGRKDDADKQWKALQDSVEGEIRNAGRGATFPDDSTRAVVTELRGRMPDDAHYQSIVDQAVANVDKEWRQAGVTHGELDGLVHDAQAADRNVASLEDAVRAPGATPAERKLAMIDLPDARSAASTAWGKVRTEVESYLRGEGTGKAFPEEAVSGHVDDLKKQYAGDAKMQSVIDQAYQTVTGEWQAQGWTRDTLGKITAGWDTVSRDQQAVNAAQGAGGPDLAALQGKLDRDRTALRQEIERQLDDVAGKVPADQRETAIGARAALITQYGPQDQAFADIVDQAAYNKVVQPGVDAVHDAYQTGGAKAAAEALRQQTENVSPATAAKIVEASLPTIDKIAGDINHSLLQGGGPIKYDDIAGVYSNVAAATDYAARSTNGAQVTADVARTMIAHLPSQPLGLAPNSPKYPVQGYGLAVAQSVADGTGATLSLEMAVQLKAAGRKDEAASLVGATRLGVEELQGKIKDGVNDFRDATGEISQLRSDWAGVMTPEQLDLATIQYVSQHTDILPNFDKSYNALDGLGYGAARTGLALDAALPRLQGIEGADDLASARSDFAGAKETQLALGVSQQANDEVLRVVLEQAAQGTTGANPTSSVTSSRGFVKELGNSLMSSQPSSLSNIADLTGGNGPAATKPATDVFGTGLGVKVDPKKVSLFGGSMNGLGAAFNGYQMVNAWKKVSQDPSNLLNQTKAVYYTIGTGKETAELLAVGAQRGWLGLDRVIPSNLSASILAKSNRTGLALEPGWAKFSAYFKIGAGAIDLAFAANAFANGDPIAGGLYSTSAAGGFIMGAGSVASSGSWLAVWGGPVGAGLVLASALGMYWYNDAKAKAHMEGPSREFLEAAGYKPEIAKALADYSDQEGTSAGPAIAATAQHFGVTPTQLMQSLNSMDPAKVHDLVQQAWTVTPDNQGQFPLTASNDRNVWAPPGKDPAFGGHYLYDPQDTRFRGTYLPTAGGPARIEDPNVRSMTALRDYARELFGAPVLG